MKLIKVGCCGFPTAKEKYFKNFNCVELQSTFYHPPELKTAQKWRAEAPSDFEFTLKAWQLITHKPSSPTYRKLRIKIPKSKCKYYGSFKLTDEVLRAWDITMEIADTLKSELIIFQCPASFTPEYTNIKNMRKFFRSIKRQGLICIWEPRGDWPKETILRLCKELNLIHCVDPFKTEPLYGNVKYFRLHGIDRYRYKYTDEDLKSLRNTLDKNIPTYIMFNNVHMLEDALNLKNLLTSRP